MGKGRETCICMIGDKSWLAVRILEISKSRKRNKKKGRGGKRYSSIKADEWRGETRLGYMFGAKLHDNRRMHIPRLGRKNTQ